MDIDLSVLRSLESEKDISLDLAIKAIEDALLVAYHKTDGAAVVARVEVNRSSGHVTVWARRTGADGEPGEEYDDTPEGFGRIAAISTAPEAISGTSIANSFFTRFGCVRDSVTDGPR